MLGDFIRVAELASKEICAVYNATSKSVETKGDGSPLTEADIRSHRLITYELSQHYPDIPILSEESANEYDWQKRKNWDRFILVDPLDGTKEFLNRNGEFTINIALIENNKPKIGVIYVPVTGECYSAESGKGAFATINQKQQMLKVAPQRDRELRVVGSRSHAGKEIEALLSSLEDPELISRGSALKFCIIAQGGADIYPRHGPTSLWDVAAGDCIVREAGGSLCDQFGNDLSYGSQESLLNPPFIAGNLSSSRLAELLSRSLV